MSFSIQKLRSILPGSQYSPSALAAGKVQTENLEPEVGFQISIGVNTQTVTANAPSGHAGDSGGGPNSYQKTIVPELNVHLIAARHLPALFGFKIVQGYLVKVKLFPGSKRLDSSVQTNSWPKFNENFRFPLAPDIKPSLKHSSRRSSKMLVSDFTPEELFAGQFVVFTVYALLELPPASFSRFNKTYRSLRDKSSNLVHNIFETTPVRTKDKDDKENANGEGDGANGNDHSKAADQDKKAKRKSVGASPRDAMPALTISEARRNIGSVTCYLEPKIFKRNSRGIYTTEELWRPIKDITTTMTPKSPNNNNENLANCNKGVVEIVLEVKDLSENENDSDNAEQSLTNGGNGSGSGLQGVKNAQWNRMTLEMKRKMGLSNRSNNNHNNNNKNSDSSNRNSNNKPQHDLVLRITTARMRCSHKVKDELECTAGTVYVKTAVFEHGVYIGSWKSSNFYPSLSTKWDAGEGDAATINVPLQHVEDLDNILIRTTLATKTKMAKKLVLGTVLVGGSATGIRSVNGSGAEHMQLLRETPPNERVPMWHCYQ